MGCTTSRQARHDLRYCPSPLALPRSQSFPARCPSDVAGAHVVRLTSSTLGSLELDSKALPWAAEPARAPARRLAPRTPTMTPPNEPEAIDAWALMSGLEEEHSPLLDAPFGRHSFSFPVAAAPPPHQDSVAAASAKVTPLPMPATTQTPVVEEKASKSKAPRRAVLYFTSLRSVRATYEACCLARAVLRGYGVRLDERDVSMHRPFRDELAGLLLLNKGCAAARSWAAPPVLLPSLFVDGELVGGAEELKRLHEAGELAARLAGCEPEAGKCEACGDVRFVLCEACSGSCKVFVDEEDDQRDEEEEEEDGSDSGGRFRRCTECNENGIVRCPACCCC